MLTGSAGFGVVGTALAALALYVCTAASGDRTWFTLANGVIPPALGGVCILAAAQTVRRWRASLWTPAPWFLAAWAVYYGLGPLAYIYGTPDSVRYMDAFYPVDEWRLLRTNILNVVGLMSVTAALASFQWVRRILRGAASDIREFPPRLAEGAPRLAKIFLSIGLPVKWLVSVPYNVGLLPYGKVPGSLTYLGEFASLAIVPLTLAARSGQRYRTALYAVLGSEVLAGLLMTSKLEVIKPLLLWGLARQLLGARLRSLVALSCALAVAYVAFLSPFVTYAPGLLGRRGAQSWRELASLVRFYVEVRNERGVGDDLGGVQGWWVRLAYPATQAFAMDRYDGGSAGKTLKLVVWAPVPRFLLPDKPITTPGREFTLLAQQLRETQSSTGLGVFGEGYWNAGWVGTIGLSITVGLLYGFLGSSALRWLARGELLWLPVMFYGIWLGLRIDDWFVPTYVGGLLLAVVTVAVLLTAGHVISRATTAGRVPADYRP